MVNNRPNEYATMVRRNLHEENRLSWNEATLAHNSHKADQVSFFRNGGSTLFPEELELLGNVDGQRLVHLQCNSGQDSLSLASLGAHVTGVDISDVAINFARDLSKYSGIFAHFTRDDIYDWFEQAGKDNLQFDVAFSSYGAIVWLSDIEMWAQGVTSILGPDGRLVILDFHPLLGVFDDDWSVSFSYFGEEKARTWETGVGDYVAESGPSLTPSGYLSGSTDFTNSFASHEFQWSLGEIVDSIIKAGLAIETLREYPYSNGAKLLPGMKAGPSNRYYLPGHLPSLPLMFGLAARR